MKISCRSLIYFLSLISLYCHFSSLTFATFSDEAEVVTKIHWVGHGNLVTIAVKDKDGKISHIMIDAGSTSKIKENIYQENCLTPVKKEFVPTTTPSSTTKKYNYRENVGHEDTKNFNTNTFDKKLISHIRSLYINKKIKKRYTLKQLSFRILMSIIIIYCPNYFII